MNCKTRESLQHILLLLFHFSTQSAQEKHHHHHHHQALHQIIINGLGIAGRRGQASGLGSEGCAAGAIHGIAQQHGDSHWADTPRNLRNE